MLPVICVYILIPRATDFEVLLEIQLGKEI